MDGMGWDLCAGLFYEHRFAMLIIMVRGGGGGVLELQAQFNRVPHGTDF